MRHGCALVVPTARHPGLEGWVVGAGAWWWGRLPGGGEVFGFWGFVDPAGVEAVGEVVAFEQGEGGALAVAFAASPHFFAAGGFDAAGFGVGGAQSGVFGTFARDADVPWGRGVAVWSAVRAAFVGEQFGGTGARAVGVPGRGGPEDGAVGELLVVPPVVECLESVMSPTL